MELLQKLAELGFTDVTVLNEDARGTAMRIMTSTGWTYERFKAEDDITRWARDHRPEVEL